MIDEPTSESAEMTEEDRAEIALADEEFERGEIVEFAEFARKMRAKYALNRPTPPETN